MPCNHVLLLTWHDAAQLEAVVSRLKLLSRLPALAASQLGRLRFVAVSATIPNVRDVGAWLGAPPGYSPSFGDEYRACALHVKGALLLCVVWFAPTRLGSAFTRPSGLPSQCTATTRLRATSFSSGVRTYSMPCVVSSSTSLLTSCATGVAGT